MKQFLLLFTIIGLFCVRSSAQVSINTDGSQPPSSVMLEVKSTTKGLLIPKMTTAQIAAIQNPADGLQVYNAERSSLYVYISLYSCWREIQFDGGYIFPAGYVFTCGGLLNDPRDGGKAYQTIQIGTQCWMKQSLNVGTMIANSYTQTNNSIIEKYCINNLVSNCDIYGGLYQWDEVMNYTTSSNNNPSGVLGICPLSWHIPSKDEWLQLTTFLGGEAIAGGKMKEIGIDHWDSPNTGATNSSLFTALGAGVRHPNTGFYNFTSEVVYWSSFGESTGTAWNLYIFTTSEAGNLSAIEKEYGFSVRCVKD